MDTTTFKHTVWSHYRQHGRHDLPWRNASANPYQILVSEIMLQQTQVDRVIPKYKVFLKQFPNFKALAEAQQSTVVKVWSGLGYNRRALNLKKTAEIVSRDFGGCLPRDYNTLVKLPGIGPYTAGAILAFAFNQPAVFIETNIRTVFLHHYFSKKLITLPKEKIHDKDILPLVEKTLDHNNPREWYYALMDYGAYLKKTVGNTNTHSAHYTKQSRFEGSRRQLRGNILKTLGGKPASAPMLAKMLDAPQKQVHKVLDELTAEGFVQKRHTRFSLA